jgi:hypothetical protein
LRRLNDGNQIDTEEIFQEILFKKIRYEKVFVKIIHQKIYEPLFWPPHRSEEVLNEEEIEPQVLAQCGQER